MRKVVVHHDTQTVTFEGGCHWKDVDNALWEHGLATPGGTVSHTGVGGLILHGGYGHLTGLHGLTIDCLQSCQVVLADGSVVTSSETENMDLFWAIRGAGSSFGVVTEFVSRAFPQGNIWGGMMMFPYTEELLQQLTSFINHWAESNDGSQGFMLGYLFGPPNEADPSAPRPHLMMVQLVHVGPDAAEAGPEYFATVLELEGAVMKQVGLMPYPVINTLGDDGLFPWGKRYQFGGANFTTPIKLSTMKAIGDQWAQFARSHASGGLERSLLLFEGISNRKVRAMRPDAMAFNSRGNYFNVGLSWAWEDPELDSEVRLFNRQFQGQIRSLGYDDEKQSDGVGVYLNYMQTAIGADMAFGSNAKRLKELKLKYDPRNSFDKIWKLAPERN